MLVVKCYCVTLTILLPFFRVNLTVPFMRAKRVKSLPMPTPSPRWYWVPRWRTRILPARTDWPPEILSPNLLPTTVVFCRALPPALVWAIIFSSKLITQMSYLKITIKNLIFLKLKFCFLSCCFEFWDMSFKFLCFRSVFWFVLSGVLWFCVVWLWLCKWQREFFCLGCGREF